jgi:patatin-related protein
MAVMGKSPEAAPAVAPVPAAPAHADTVELRLALVCYGGVSLAIYMHGVTKEIQKLVAASKAYEQDQRHCRFERDETEWAYWHALQERESRDHVRTRVVVDVIAGTSAGGINGIILAKAIAHDLPQDALRDVWLERGDIKKLMASRVARAVPSLPLKLLAWAGMGALKRRLDPPLDGDRMFGWIRDALEEMDEGAVANRTLMPEQHPLELYVTLTDFYGYYRGVPTYDPKRVKDRRHRHVLVFSYVDGRDQLNRDWNPELSFAARATSCFPGAFPPINLANIDHNVPGWEGSKRFKESFWSIYPLSGADVDKTHFVDGGVLDNFPFRHAIDAVRARPASLEVDRRLVYIEPHPAAMRKPPDGTAPTLRATVAGGLSALPRHEPILDDLLELRAFNERVERVNDIVEAARDKIFELAPPPMDVAAYADASEQAIERAKTGFAYATYTQLKLHSVVDRFAELACEVCRFPRDSNHAFFVHDALTEWARRRQLLRPEINPTPEQVEFLKAFDLGYAERRLRFVVRHLNSLYESGVDRDSVNRAKERVYGLLAELQQAAGQAGDGGRGDAVRSVFPPERVGGLIDSELPPDQVIGQFVDEHGDELDSLRAGLHSFLDEHLGDFGQNGYRSLLEATEGWDDMARQNVLARYIGFPLWDVLIFPISAVSDVGELNRVEVVRFSPEDVKLLHAPGQKGERPTTEEKLKGVAAGHFAAFFSRDRRENDYLWGRLDGAERMVALLLGDPPVDLCHAAFGAVLDQEEPNLGEVPGLIGHLRSQLRQG